MLCFTRRRGVVLAELKAELVDTFANPSENVQKAISEKYMIRVYLPESANAASFSSAVGCGTGAYKVTSFNKDETRTEPRTIDTD